jgi:hypothetical protein
MTPHRVAHPALRKSSLTVHLRGGVEVLLRRRLLVLLLRVVGRLRRLRRVERGRERGRGSRTGSATARPLIAD